MSIWAAGVYIRKGVALPWVKNKNIDVNIGFHVPNDQ